VTDTMVASDEATLFPGLNTATPSDVEATPEPTEADDTPVVESEAVEGAAETEVAPQYVDIEELGDHLVKVKVNGEEYEVPLREAASGYMRQDAFTRKTQALAEQAKRLQHADALVAALDRDPHRTVQALAEAYDISFEQDGEGEELDPVQQKLDAIEQRLQADEQAKVSTAIESEIQTLQQTHGEFDVDDLINFTLARPGITLTDAYAVMNFGRVADKQQKTEQITDAKRAAQVVAGSGSTQKGSVSKPKEFKTTRDAIVAALREGGVPV
jgi:hypothetical protein